MIGFTKSGIPSLGILVVTMLMFVFSAKDSIGILLPMLVMGDLFAVSFYRKNVVWKHLITLFPWVIIGLLCGYVTLCIVNSDQLKPIIGVIVLVMISLHILREKLGGKFNEMLPKSLWFTLLIGIFGGFTTMIGNAAGGIMAIYLFVKGLPKSEFVGTGAWFFMFVNLIKVPFYIQLGLITTTSFTLNLIMLPVILAGALIGVKVLPNIPQKTFQMLVLGFAALGGIRLLF